MSQTYENTENGFVKFFKQVFLTLKQLSVLFVIIVLSLLYFTAQRDLLVSQQIRLAQVTQLNQQTIQIEKLKASVDQYESAWNYVAPRYQTTVVKLQDRNDNSAAWQEFQNDTFLNRVWTAVSP